MRYHIDVDIDYGAMGERREELRRTEWAMTQRLLADGVVVIEWIKASGQGVLAVWDCDSHDQVYKLLKEMPLYPYFKRLEITPCVDHPLFPRGRATAAGAVATP